MTHKKIIIITLILILSFSLTINADTNMQRLSEIKKEVKQAEENYDRSKIINLKKEAGKLVNNLETATMFKEIFPDLPNHDNDAEAVVEKLSKLLNKNDLYSLMNIYPENNSIDNVHRSLLAKSDSLNDIKELLNQVPDNNYIFHPAKSKAVKYVDDLESAKHFKNIFTNLDSYDKEAREIYKKLKNRLNRKEIIELAEIYNNQSFAGIDSFIFQKSESIEDVMDTVERYPDFMKYNPSQVEKLAYKFVNDRESAKNFLSKFPDSNDKYITGAKKYLNEDSFSTVAKKEQEFKSEIEEKNDDYQKSGNIDIYENQTDGYKKLIKLETAVNSGHKGEMSAKKEAVKYVDSVASARKFKDIFYNSIVNSDVSNITKNLVDILNKNKIKELIAIFSEYPSARDLIYAYIDRSQNLDEVIAASKEFRDHKYQSKAYSKGLEFVNDLDSAIKYKTNFFEHLEISNNNANYQIYEIVKNNLKNAKSMSEAIKISKDFSDVFSLNKLGNEVTYLIDSKDSFLKFLNYYTLCNFNVDSILNQLSKEELLAVAKTFNNNEIKNAARNRYFNQSSSYQDYKNVILYFPEYKTEAVNLVLNMINNINDAVKVKNLIPEIEDDIEVSAFYYVNDLYSAETYLNEFSVDDKKSKIVKRLMKSINQNNLGELLDVYNVSVNRDEIFDLSNKYQQVKTDYELISSENPEFNIQGEIEDRSRKGLYIRGEAYPINANPNVYGTLLDTGNIYILSYDQNKINAYFYVSRGHYLIKRGSGKNYFGQEVPVWIYGDKPENLINIEKKLNQLKKQIDKLIIKF